VTERAVKRNPLANAPLHPIDWSTLSAALEWYTSEGFEYVEVPWAVPTNVVAITLPATRAPYGVIEDGRNFQNALVGSAEQSFLHVTLRGILGLGTESTPRSYVAISPCFRDDAIDQVHQKQFMKVELFEPYHLEASEAFLNDRLRRVIRKARDFFLKYIPVENLEVVSTREGWDIMGNGVELGSYGIRVCQLPGTTLDVFTWVYGTGVAEPRLSQVRGMQ
jgi:hypothetical protein